LWCLLAVYYDREVPFPLIMKVQVYWSEITHYTNEVEIPFDDFDSQECQDYICEMSLPVDNAKQVGFEIERNSVDVFEVE
jgi:hypothetical protein